MTKEMREFLTAWLAWATSANPIAYIDGGAGFRKDTGLCSNISVYLGEERGGSSRYYALYGELGNMLEDDGLDTDYPFDTEESYGEAFRDSTQHLNPARLEWVRSKLESKDA